MEASQARHPFCKIAVKRLYYTGASVARSLGASTPLVNGMAGREKMNKIDAILESSL